MGHERLKKQKHHKFFYLLLKESEALYSQERFESKISWFGKWLYKKACHSPKGQCKPHPVK